MKREWVVGVQQWNDANGDFLPYYPTQTNSRPITVEISSDQVRDANLLLLNDLGQPLQNTNTFKNCLQTAKSEDQFLAIPNF